MESEDEWLCIQLTRTRGWEERDRTDDELVDPEGLIRWARDRGVLDSCEARSLDDEARSCPVNAAAHLAHARRLRAVIHGVLRAVGQGREPDAELLEALNRELAAARAQRRLHPAGARFAWSWADDTPPLRRIAWEAALSAARLLTSSEAEERLKACAADDCGWVFVDRSRNRSRRWCDMSDCGNRAKVDRHRRRTQGEPAGGG